MDIEKKILIVEGKTDRDKVKKLLDESVEIICTHGTISYEKLEELIDSIEDREIYILVDEDDAGQKLRKILKRELPNANHLYTQSIYKEVAETPSIYLAKILLNANFQVNTSYLLNGGAT